MMKVNSLWAVLIYSDMKFNFNFYDDTDIGILRRSIDRYNALAEVAMMQIILNNIFNTVGDDCNCQTTRLEYFEKEFNKNFDNFNKVSFTSKKFDEYMFDPNSKSTVTMSEYYICTSVAEFYSVLLYLHFQSSKRINVCRLCGKLFTPKTAKATAYCYGKYDGQKCQDLGPHIASRKLQKNDEVLGWSDLKVKNLKLQKQTYLSEDKELTKDEYYRLLNAAKNNQRLHLIIETICSTGIRVSELKYFTVESVRKGTIVVNCKSKTRSILVPRKLKDKILKFAKQHNISSGIVFRTRSGRAMNRSNIWAEMKKLCKSANVNPSKVFPHNLRKLFARTFYGIEKDIAKLADILGHSTIDTTRIYIMSSGNEHRRKIERLGLVV